MPGIIVLAAGTSSRMGKVKQLLPWGRTTLLQHAIEVALESKIGPVGVVVGANADLIYPHLLPLLEHQPVTLIHHENYTQGQGTSLQAGVQWAMRQQWTGVLIMLADQPLLTPADLRRIFEKSDDAEIVGSGYGKNLGVPAYFKANTYAALLTIPPQEGAKSLFSSGFVVKEVDVPHALKDVDTIEDYLRLKQEFQGVS